MLVRNIEPKQGRIRAEHEFQDARWITGYFRRTLISYRLYESGNRLEEMVRNVPLYAYMEIVLTKILLWK